jgi:transglutaminase-like putative cysteine protease
VRTYRLMHVTRYGYDEPVSTSYGRAHLKPADHPGQRCLRSDMFIEPDPAETSEHTDYFGNLSTYFCVRTEHTELVVTARSDLAIDRSAPSVAEVSEESWEQVRDSLVEHPTVTEYVLPSPRIGPAHPVDEYAASVFSARLPMGVAVHQLLRRIYTDFTYKSGATTVRTTLPQLLERRAGVCQDFAHLAVASLRSVGLAARYVSGYLETQPPPGKPKLQGADASHAWASVYIPGLGWWDFDPTNDQFVDDRYIVTAVGRDYSDVPPLKGVIITDAKESTLDVSVDVIRLD